MEEREASDARASVYLSGREESSLTTLPGLAKPGQQDIELSSRSQECDKFRHGQFQFVAELRNQERVHQETFLHVNKEGEELRNIRRHEAELRREAIMDAILQDGGNNLDTALRESQSTVNQLTHQMNELRSIL